MVIDEAKKHGLMKSYPLVFIKNYSSQVIKGKYENCRGNRIRSGTL